VPGDPMNVPLTRRRLLGLGASAAGAAMLGPVAAAAARAGRSQWPTRALPAHAARSVSPRDFMPVGPMQSWQDELDGLGLRATGIPSQNRYIESLHARLSDAGVQQLHLEPVPIRRWTADAWSLEVIDGPGAGNVPLAAYVPYSGSTRPDGVTAPLSYVPAGTAPAPGSLAGRIAVLEVPQTSLTYSEFGAIAYPGETYDPTGQETANGIYSRPWLAIASFVTLLDQLGPAGAVGAVCILDVPGDAAHGSYWPYTGVINDVPAVFVERGAGATVASQAQAGARGRLRLTARVEEVTTHNLIGVIPGASDEIVILHSHTDGTNGLEDNGPNAIVAMSQYLARISRVHLPRTVMVLLTTGHFHGGIGTKSFLERHAHTSVPRAAAALTIEHLGAREWNPVDDHSALTGQFEPATIFAPEISALVQPAGAALRRGNIDPGSVLRPFTAVPGSPDGNGWPGEGTLLWTSGAIPTMNFITGPTYLLNWGIPVGHKIDVAKMRAESIAFTELLLTLGRTDRTRLRTLDLLGKTA
jgi:hypothetical protein